MRRLILFALLVVLAAALSAPALAATYPVDGRWGQSTTTQKGAIDCAKLRVVGFNGQQRTDTGGSVPAFRNVSVTPNGPAEFKIVDEFSNGQINRGRVNYTLRKIDADRIELHMQPGGTVKLQRCK